MSRAQRTEGWAKRPRARVLAFLFLVVISPYLSLSLCTSLVAPPPPAPTDTSPGSCLSLYPLFLILFLLFILWLGWVYGILSFPRSCSLLVQSRDLAQ